MSKKVGRPRKEIDKKDFESLCAIQCSTSEIVSFMDMKYSGCSWDTIDRWCQRTYKESFAKVAKSKKEIGKINLRRIQFEQAKKSIPMAIFLGKNYLGQSDSIQQTVEVTEPVKIIRQSDGGLMIDDGK